ncbi:MAG: histidinol dehydrogenase, partial [Ignavibacteriaceae bacterium]|nr:histidinol dehydrogenase [Ignavibacteriaceae bacterium]
MKRYLLNSLSEKEITALTRRPAIDFEKTFAVVRPILDEIKKDGLKAVVKYAKQFDGFSSPSIYVEEHEFAEAESSLNPKVKDALKSAFSNIFAFHKEEFPRNISE